MGVNLFLFTFENTKEMNDVLNRGPWYVMGHLLSLQCWVPEASVYEIDFSRTSFWIQIHGLPLDMMSTGNAARIMSKVGEVMEVENPCAEGNLLRTFIRIRVLVNIQEPLPTGCWVPRKSLPKLWILFRYEKLQALCFNCGIVGHEQRSCKENKVMAPFNPGIPKKKMTMEEGQRSQMAEEEDADVAKAANNTGTTTIAEDTLSQQQKDNGGQHLQPTEKQLTTTTSDADTGEKNWETAVDLADKNTGVPEGALVDTTEEEVYIQQEGNKGIPSNSQAQREQQSVKGHLTQPQLPMGPKVPTGTDTTPSYVTQTDLITKQMRAGLGPKRLEDLHIAKEFTGLKEAQIILDYPSPTFGKIDVANLSHEVILKVKAACQTQGSPTTNITLMNNNTLGELGYYVQFPDDEDYIPTTHIRPPTIVQIHQDEERQLILGWNHSLSLKRGRSQWEGQQQSIEQEVGNNARKRIHKLEWEDSGDQGKQSGTTRTVNFYNWNLTKVEEASQTMPHPQP
ncbi:Zinc finger, CCHC-type [Sesbania bispinosa]|nr:Zinc finger, CCHC-type [Sesbania bispinosa]